MNTPYTYTSVHADSVAIPLIDASATARAAFDTLMSSNTVTNQTPHVKRPTPVLNKIYFNKKTPYVPMIDSTVLEKMWNIPFSVDVDVPVSEITERIDKVMTDTKAYKSWRINFSTFEILAMENSKYE